MTNVYSIDGKKTGTVKLPEQFSEDLRTDLIKRAVLAIQNNERQAYGADPRAGMKTAAENRGRRKSYGAWINRAMHRTVRIRVGQGSLTGRARIVPHAVKGRKAHPPKAEKNWTDKINDKERKLAIRSAISATAVKDIVTKRGHKTETVQEFPIIIEDTLQTLKKTKDVTQALKKLGLETELERCSQKKVRAGKGTMRGRKYKTKTGPLVVVSKLEVDAYSNIAGVVCVDVNSLNAELLAPGTHAGRLTVWTKSAIDALEKNNLYM